MKESEIKIFGIDSEGLLAKLVKLKARKVFTGLMKVHYFDSPDGRIASSGAALRLREMAGKGAELTYKTNRRFGCEGPCAGNLKIFDEYEVPLPDSSAIFEIFRNLGLRESLYFEKKRHEFKLGGAKICIDIYPKIPPYCEIETSDGRGTDGIIKKLGLAGLETSAETVFEVFKNRYPKIRLNGLRF